MNQVILEATITGAVAALAIGAFNYLYQNSSIMEFPWWANCLVVGGIAAGSSHISKALLPRVQAYTGLSGFGESLEEINKNIELYKKHIKDLNKVLEKGSDEGKQAASKKLATVEQDLKTWEAKKETALKIA